MNHPEELDAIKRTFEENGYKVSLNDDEIVIRKRHSSMAIILYVLLCVFALPLIFADIRMTLFLVLLVGFPFIYRRWMMPRKVIISKLDHMITVGRNEGTEIAFDNIKGIEVDEDILSSDVSPFKEGNQDFVYVFKIKTLEDKVIRLFDLEFRKPMHELIKTIFDYFDSAITRGEPTYS